MNILKNKNIILFAFILIISQFISIIFFSILKDYFTIHKLLMATIAQILFIFIPSLIFIKYQKLNFKELRFNKLNIKQILLCITLGFSLQPIGNFISSLLNYFFKSDYNISMLFLLNNPIILLIIVASIIPAFVEEFAFRSIIFSQYKNTNIFHMCVLNGFIFGLIHLNFIQFFYAFVLGFIFCLIVNKTNSVYSSMLIHFIINTSQIIMGKLMLNNNNINFSFIYIIIILTTSITISYKAYKAL